MKKVLTLMIVFTIDRCIKIAERERERKRETDRQRERQREREGGR